MEVIHEPSNPTGRIYRDAAGAEWTVELEIGGAVWLCGPGNEIQLARLETLRNMERVA